MKLFVRDLHCQVKKRKNKNVIYTKTLMDIKINYVRDLCHTISVQIQYVTVGVSI